MMENSMNADRLSAGGVPDLTGKTLVVQTRNRPLSMPTVLGECRFEMQGGRLYLVGVRQPCSPAMPSWTDGVPSCVAWDCVEEYMTFESLADYHTRLNQPESTAEATGQDFPADPPG